MSPQSKVEEEGKKRVKKVTKKKKKKGQSKTATNTANQTLKESPSYEQRKVNMTPNDDIEGVMSPTQTLHKQMEEV